MHHVSWSTDDEQHYISLFIYVQVQTQETIIMFTLSPLFRSFVQRGLQPW